MSGAASLCPESVEAAFLAACRAEIETLKPGNVHRFAAGHGMSTKTFEDAALASAPAIAEPGASVGTRVFAATEASWAAVGLNANLGIVLLAAPLAKAAETLGHSPAKEDAAQRLERLRAALHRVLSDLTAEDTALVFAAIARASPGGLGERDEHDVRRAPQVTLVEAMRLAAPRDLVARQYADGFAEIFETGIPPLVDAARNGDSPWQTLSGRLGPALAPYMAFAAGFPDSHVGRKFGPAKAEEVRARFGRLRQRLAEASDLEQAFRIALGFDTELKAEGLNPGTSADLTVASLFAFNLAEAGGE